jgi:hypothetical protein
VEIAIGERIIESWDGKYGKTYLYGELSELEDKLKMHHGAELAGFITDRPPLIKDEIKDLKESIEFSTGAEVRIMDFDSWINYKTEGASAEDLSKLGNEWLTALVESLCQKRRAAAPIDEPCDTWIRELMRLMKGDDF